MKMLDGTARCSDTADEHLVESWPALELCNGYTGWKNECLRIWSLLLSSAWMGEEISLASDILFGKNRRQRIVENACAAPGVRHKSNQPSRCYCHQFMVGQPALASKTLL